LHVLYYLVIQMSCDCIRVYIQNPDANVSHLVHIAAHFVFSPTSCDSAQNFVVGRFRRAVVAAKGSKFKQSVENLGAKAG
jgi:hypothetical protein